MTDADETRAKNRDDGTRKRTLTVTGPHAINGKRKGETVELEFSEALIDMLIEAGHVSEQGSRRVEGFDPLKVTLGIPEDAAVNEGWPVPAELDPTVTDRAPSAQTKSKG